MKVGLILEGIRDGADQKVCEHLAERIRPGIQIKSEALGNKPNLIAKCGSVAAQLLDDGCERVVIVWDLYPAWREGKPCRKLDRDGIMKSLVAENVDFDKIALVCIEEELEAWLLADHRALSDVLSKPHRQVNIKRQKYPERGNPKTRLIKIFNEHRGHTYQFRFAESIVRAMPDLNRIKRVATFRRFALKVADVEL
ncbi:MAG: hypothetical protein OXE46_10865 [Chloroflexi bacterium]|nr:hypothetical protein [Chloroflexota bacterium]